MKLENSLLGLSIDNVFLVVSDLVVLCIYKNLPANTQLMNANEAHEFSVINYPRALWVDNQRAIHPKDWVPPMRYFLDQICREHPQLRANATSMPVTGEKETGFGYASQSLSRDDAYKRAVLIANNLSGVSVVSDIESIDQMLVTWCLENNLSDGPRSIFHALCDALTF